jgi:hypothetical protein
VVHTGDTEAHVAQPGSLLQKANRRPNTGKFIGLPAPP